MSKYSYQRDEQVKIHFVYFFKYILNFYIIFYSQNFFKSFSIKHIFTTQFSKNISKYTPKQARSCSIKADYAIL